MSPAATLEAPPSEYFFRCVKTTSQQLCGWSEAFPVRALRLAGFQLAPQLRAALSRFEPQSHSVPLSLSLSLRASSSPSESPSTSPLPVSPPRSPVLLRRVGKSLYTHR